MRIILLTLMLLLPIVARANNITFTNASTTFTLPAGFSPGFQGAIGDDKGWKYFSASPDGNGRIAAFRLMGAMGTLTPDQYGSVGVFWSALLNDTPFTGLLAFTTTVTACYGGECKPVSFSGSLGYSPNGLTWTQPIQATTVALGGAMIQFWDTSNAPRGIVQTVDGGISYRIIPQGAPVPEPASLTLIGLGLLGFARRLRNKL